MSTKQERIAELARNNPAMAFTSLNYYLDYEWMEYAYQCTRKDGAVGVDGQTAQDYAVDLEGNLRRLLDRLKSGTYCAPPVRRHYIPKMGGGQRALGIPGFEDKVAQRAIVMLLEPIYEQVFLDCSFGFRTGRSAHQALQLLRNGIMERGGRWILDIDIRKYFASISHAKLRELLARRVTDGVVRRMIDKWLKAGVLEEGQLYYPEEGTPEGGVISPVLSNIVLHYVLDDWFTHVVKPRLRGPCTLVRFADDFVMLFAYKDDAERVWRVLAKRLGRFGLQIHPDKSRMVDFRYQPTVTHAGGGTGFATVFNFLGFTHLWVLSRRGKPVVRQQMAKDRFARALRTISQQCRRMQHWPLREQHRRLCQTLRGLYGYFGISGNSRRLSELGAQAQDCWRKWLSRRSNASHVTWDKFEALLRLLPLPAPFLRHRYTAT